MSERVRTQTLFTAAEPKTHSAQCALPTAQFHLRLNDLLSRLRAQSTFNVVCGSTHTLAPSRCLAGTVSHFLSDPGLSAHSRRLTGTVSGTVLPCGATRPLTTTLALALAVPSPDCRSLLSIYYTPLVDCPCIGSAPHNTRCPLSLSKRSAPCSPSTSSVMPPNPVQINGIHAITNDSVFTALRLSHFERRDFDVLYRLPKPNDAPQPSSVILGDIWDLHWIRPAAPFMLLVPMNRRPFDGPLLSRLNYVHSIPLQQNDDRSWSLRSDFIRDWHILELNLHAIWWAIYGTVWWYAAIRGAIPRVRLEQSFESKSSPCVHRSTQCQIRSGQRTACRMWE